LGQCVEKKDRSEWKRGEMSHIKRCFKGQKKTRAWSQNCLGRAKKKIMVGNAEDEKNA